MVSDKEDSEYQLSDEDNEDTSPYTLRRRPVEDALQVEGTNSGLKRVRSGIAASDGTPVSRSLQQSQQLQLPTDRRAIAA